LWVITKHRITIGSIDQKMSTDKDLIGKDEAAVLGLMQNDNIVVAVNRIREVAESKYGAAAALITLEVTWERTQREIEDRIREVHSVNAPWHGIETAVTEIEKTAPKLLGWLRQCMSRALADTLELEGAFSVKEFDYVRAVRTVMSALKNIAVGQGSGSAQQSAFLALVTMKMQTGESLEAYLLRFQNAYALVTEGAMLQRTAAGLLLCSLIEQQELYRELLRVIPKEGYATVPMLVGQIKQIMQWMVSYKKGGATTMVATDGNEVAAAAVSKDKCDYCSIIRCRDVWGHVAFNKDGEPSCYKLKDNWDRHTEYVKANPPPERKPGGKSGRRGKDSRVDDDCKSTVTKPSKYIDFISSVGSHQIDRKTVLCDSGSSITVFNDAAWLIDTSKCEKMISGVGGEIRTSHVGESVYGKAYLCVQMPMSIVSTNALAQDPSGFQVEYRFEGNEFQITGKEVSETFRVSESLNVPHIVAQPRNPERDYAGAAILPTDNSRSARKVAAAAELHRNSNHVPYRQLARTIKLGALDTDVSAADMSMAEERHPCPVCTATRTKHEKRGGQYHPAHLAGQYLRCDVVYVRGGNSVKRPHHLVCDERTGWTDADKMSSTKASDVCEAQKRVVAKLRAKGLLVERLYYDDDKTVAATMVAMGEIGVEVKQWAAFQHEVGAENRLQTAQRDMAAVLADLPYIFPDFLLEYALKDTCEVRNTMVNVKTGGESPFTIIENEKPSRHGFDIHFGQLVWAETPVVQGNPLAPRRAHAIVIGRDFSTRGKCTVFFLHNKTIGHRMVYQTDVIKYPEQELYDILNKMSSTPYDVNDVVSATPSDLQMYPDLSQDVPIRPMAQPHVNVWRANRDANEGARAVKRAAYKARQEVTEKQDNANTEERIEDTTAEAPAIETTTEEDAGERTVLEADTHIPEPVAEQLPDKEVEVRPNPEKIRRSKKAKPTQHEGELQEPYARAYKPRGERRSTVEARTESQENTDELEQTNAVVEKRAPKRRSKAVKQMFDAMVSKIQERKDAQVMSDVAYVNLTLNQLLNKGKQGEEAVMKEVRNIIVAGSLEPRHHYDLTDQQKREAITAFIFGKEKLDKQLKARNVMNGAQLQDRPEYRDLVSPTADKMTTMIHLAVASFEKRQHVVSADFPSAYLKVERARHDMPREFTRITGKLAELMVKEEPSWSQYMRHGAIYFEIMKSIYGLTESAALWFKELRKMLLEMGYSQQTETDPCLFIHKETNSAVNIHVDDCLCSFTTDEEKDRVLRFFEKHKCTVKKENFTFLGMDIWQRKDKIIQMNMKTFLQKYLKEHKVIGYEEHPTRTDFMKDHDSEKAPKRQQVRFVAAVMALMYAAVRVRLDILFPVAILSQKCKDPTLQDVADLEHLERYINRTVDKGITLDTNSLDIHVWADASFMLHPDKKGQTGVAVTLGEKGPCIAPKSSKTKMLASSSTGAEIISCYEATPLLRMASGLMKAFGHQSLPSMRQDNQSAIAMMETGRGTGKHTKHFDLRLKILQEMIQNEEFATVYTPTESMLADVFTKPMTGKKHKTYVDALMCTEKEQNQRTEDQTMMTNFILMSAMPSSRGCAKGDPKWVSNR